MRAFKYHAEVKENGTVELPKLPFKKGEKIEIIILPESEESFDLMSASESSLNFWDNPVDDEIWNNA